MSVEDGAVLGKLLGLLKSDMHSQNMKPSKTVITDVLKLYEGLRKDRTNVIVQGALKNREMYHLHDGPGQERRDSSLKVADWLKPNDLHWANPSSQMDLLGFDAVKSAQGAFDDWLRCRSILPPHQVNRKPSL